MCWCFCIVCIRGVERGTLRRRPQLGPKRLPSHHHHGQRTPCSDQRRRATMSVDAPNGMHLTGSSHPITSGERPAGTIWLRTAVIARIAPTSFHTDEVRARCWVGLTASAPLLALPWLSPPRPPAPDWKGGYILRSNPMRRTRSKASPRKEGARDSR